MPYVSCQQKGAVKSNIRQQYKQLAPAPLYAVNVFCGGDDWHTLICQVGGTPAALLVQPAHQTHFSVGIH
jgi:hypothetical protein